MRTFFLAGWVLLTGLLMIWGVLPAWGSAGGKDPSVPTDLTELSLEELMNIEVTLASRKEEKLFETAAAIFVITQDDLRRSGVTSLPEALRLVPGMQVARMDANKWAVSARGFNDRFAQKLLVLIDGRTVYTPMFSGVFWEIQDVLLEDVDRIEVIRGPGATLWGANAVNGIINITTKNAHDTQGGLVRVGIGTEERGFGAVRYGGRMAEDACFRFYGKYFVRDAFVVASGEPGADDWSMFRGGFRGDWQVLGRGSLTVQGDLFSGEARETVRIPSLSPPFEQTSEEDIELSGGDVLARWEQAYSPGSDLALQVYYDRNRRMDSVWLLIDRETYDVDFQHRFALGARQEVVWGLGYRFSRDETEGSFLTSFDPAGRSTDLFSAFLQDDVRLVEGRLRLTVGSKFEQNDFSGFEVQPNVRLLWTPHSWQTAWAAVSRAVRTPARVDEDVRLAFQAYASEELLPISPPGSPPFLVTIEGDGNFDSEQLLAFEVGYRIRPIPELFLDIAGFFNDYRDLRAARDTPLSLGTLPGPPHLRIPLVVDNLMEGETYGAEGVAEWQLPGNRGRLRAAYTYLKVDLQLKPGANPESATPEMGNPEHQFYLQSSLDLYRGLQLDGILRYVSRLPGRESSSEASYPDLPYVERLRRIDIPGYVELDLRVGWHPTQNVEVSITGQNLLDSHHPEFEDFFISTHPTETERGVYGAVKWMFAFQGR